MCTQTRDHGTTRLYYQRLPSLNKVETRHPLSSGLREARATKIFKVASLLTPRHAQFLKQHPPRDGKKKTAVNFWHRSYPDVISMNPSQKATVQSTSRVTKQLVILSCQEDDDPFTGSPRVSALPRNDGHERVDHLNSKVGKEEEEKVRRKKDASFIQSALMR